MEELVSILNEDGTSTYKSIDKKIAHINGICHGISAVGLINNKGELLLQKRVKTKKLEPDKWDLSGAGHIDINESPEEAAVRETYEELGIRFDKKDLIFVNTFLVKLKINDDININHYTYLYIIKKDININDIIINKKEISDIRYVNKEEYNYLLNSNKTVEGIKYCNKVLDYMK